MDKEALKKVLFGLVIADNRLDDPLVHEARLSLEKMLGVSVTYAETAVDFDEINLKPCDSE